MYSKHLTGEWLNLCYEISSLEKGRGGVSLQTTNMADVFSMSGLDFANWKLQAYSFVLCVRLLWGIVHPTIAMCCFAPFG